MKVSRLRKSDLPSAESCLRGTCLSLLDRQSSGPSGLQTIPFGPSGVLAGKSGLQELWQHLDKEAPVAEETESSQLWPEGTTGVSGQGDIVGREREV
ncbi:hypothetical protein F2P79_023766 [Pimephales promelas]|nr:hypothetical protein F2P79_023766 [Pimephales promelas]